MFFFLNLKSDPKRLLKYINLMLYFLRLPQFTEESICWFLVREICSIFENTAFALKQKHPLHSVFFQTSQEVIHRVAN